MSCNDLTGVIVGAVLIVLIIATAAVMIVHQIYSKSDE